jgi:hypothetical protein
MFAVIDGGRADLSVAPQQKFPEPALGNRLLVPQNPGQLASHYDLTISHPAIDMPSYAAFGRWLAQFASARGLSCALVHDGIVRDVCRRLEQEQLTIGFHLDYFALWHVADDPYARLAQAVQDSGGQPVNSPARSRFFTDKANAHMELQAQGLGVPETVLIRPWTADRPLTRGERQRLCLHERDARVYLKPANGFSGNGIVRVDITDADSFARALATARNFDRRDAYLVQREIRSPVLKCQDGIERPAYWRILLCMGELMPFWWSKQEIDFGRPSYRPLAASEIEMHRLQPVLAFAEELALLCGLQWFSTELCLSEGADRSKYSVRGRDGRDRAVLAIDYVNDQCDVDVQSRWLGAPPDNTVRHLAERFAEAASMPGQILRLPAEMASPRKAA